VDKAFSSGGGNRHGRQYIGGRVRFTGEARAGLLDTCLKCIEMPFVRSESMHMPKRRAGFTLVELSAVIAIVGTLSAVALPRYVDMMRSARVARMEMARGAVTEAAQMYHMKWILAGSPARPTVLDKVPMNEMGYPTGEGIVLAAGLSATYDTRVAGVIAVDPRHPECNLAYAPETGTSVAHYAADAAC
jgi:MSHA pilin protein MshA